MVELDTWAGLEPAVMDIKTVSGLAQVFELTLTDSAGSTVDLEGVTFRGAVNTAPLREFACSVEGGKVLFGWSGLPAGRHSFDLYMVTGNVERALLRGAMVVSGRTMPPLKQESYSVNNAATLVFPDTVDGTILIELSEVGLVDLLSRRAGAFAEEGKEHLRSIRELKEWIEGKVDGFGDVVVQATTAITEAGTVAAGAVEAGRTEAVKAVSSEKEGALALVKEAGETAGRAITEAGRDAVKSVTEGRDGAAEAISTGKENALTAVKEAENAAITDFQKKQSDAVLAVGRAQKTATDNVADSQNAAVQAVQTAQTEAVKTISSSIERVEAAEEEIGKMEVRVSTAVDNASQSAQEASDSAIAAHQALEAIPQMDEAGNMTLDGGLTTSGTHNANGGINIPLTVGLPMDTEAVNRAYALGMAYTVMMHQARTYWLTSSCTATNGVTINHVVPGCYCEARLGVNQHTSLTMRTTGVVGGSNYSKNLGYSFPLRASGGAAGYWFKVSMIIGSGGEWTEYPDAGRDDYRFRPVAGSAPDISRLVDVTIYYDGVYKARVRELIGVGIPRQYVVRTTESTINYNSNTGLAAAAYRLVISQSELSYSDKLAASVWLIIGGAANDTVIKLADIRGWDTYHTSYAPTLYLDVLAGEYGEIIQMESPTILNGIGNNTYLRYGLEPFQRSWIVSETEVPYNN